MDSSRLRPKAGLTGFALLVAGLSSHFSFTKNLNVPEWATDSFLFLSVLFLLFSLIENIYLFAEKVKGNKLKRQRYLSTNSFVKQKQLQKLVIEDLRIQAYTNKNSNDVERIEELFPRRIQSKRKKVKTKNDEKTKFPKLYQ